MKVFAGALSLAVALMSASSAAQAAGPAAAVAVIDVEAAPNGVRISGRALALSAGRFEATMRVEKSGPAGRSNTTQGGSATLDAGKSSSVATVGLSVAPGDRLEVELVLTGENGAEVARNTLVVGDNRI